MKKSLLPAYLFLFSVFFFFSLELKGQFNLIFEENFDVEGAPDSTYWSYCSRTSVDWAKYLVSNNPETVEVKEGKLFLRSIKNLDQTTDNVPYLTGGVQTKGKVGIRYGKVEVRAKLPEGQGSFPAIWMMPKQATYGGWPRSGEIDIMEHLNFDNYIYHTIHSYYATNPPNGLGNKIPNDHTTATYNKNQFNTYSLEWYPDRLVFLVNGVTNLTYPRLDPAVQWQWPYDHEFYLILNSSCNGSWGGPVTDSHLPFEMEVDWVKIYELQLEDYNVPLWSGANDFDSNFFENTYVENITATGTIDPYEINYSSKPDEYFTVVDEKIKVESGADFSINLKAFSLGSYNESVVLQDLRYTCVYAYADMNGDYSYETSLPRIGNQPPLNDIGGNMESMDVTFNFQAPDVTQESSGRIRVVYNNAWYNHPHADAPVYEGLVYDFDLEIYPLNANISNPDNFKPQVYRLDDVLYVEGLNKEAVISVYDITGKLILNKIISNSPTTIHIPQQLVIVKIQNADGQIFRTKL